MKTFIALALLTAGIAQAQNYNTSEGQNAFSHNTYGSYDSAFGMNAMYYNTQGYYNSSFGAHALEFNSTGSSNTAVGAWAAYNSITGSNTAIGLQALYGNQTGNGNIAIGVYAGGVPAAGNNNIHIGNAGLAKDNNVIRIGTQGTQKFTQIAGIYNTKLPAGGGQFVMVNAKGQLGIVSTTLHTSVATVATQADIATLRTDLVAAKNMIYDLQRQVVALKAVRVIK